MAPSRDFEIVLFGATGFTGKLVAEYLAGQGGSLRWALAGRNLEKLQAVRSSLPSGVRPELLVADAHDEAALAAIARRTTVVATTVGPYARHGLPLVGACAAAGTHYCDLTGEVTFIRRSIDRFHAAAQASRARIVHCCGYDSIPSDLGALMLVEAARERGLGALAEVRFVAGRSKGGVSGGTVASMLGMLDEAAADRAQRRLLGDPYALSPDREHDLDVDGPDQRGLRWDAELESWTGPFVMAAINTRVVRRSNALEQHAYGPRFSYSESMGFGPGPRGLALATAVTAGLGGFLALASSRATRRLLERRLPQPGEGPSEQARRSGFFVVDLVATTESGRRLYGRVEGRSDPGYGETAKMMGESALGLARGPLRAMTGVLTPATALGRVLTERLRAAGMRFDVAETRF